MDPLSTKTAVAATTAQGPAAFEPQLPDLSLQERQRQAKRPLLWDGGLGTGLIARGLDLSREPPEAWLLSHPDVVTQLHASFAEAEVDVLQTCSFGLVRHFLGGWPVSTCGPMPPLKQLVSAAVQLAQKGAQHARHHHPQRLLPTLVASLGPTVISGLDPSQLADAYGEIAWLFAQAGVRALHLETCLDPSELRAALKGIRAVAPDLELLVSLTLTHGQMGLETPLGVPLARMLRELTPEPPAWIGLNCSLPARKMTAAVAALAQWCESELRSPIPVLVQPQVDQPAPDCKRPSLPETDTRFATDTLRLLDVGATALGGCCGATALHLQALRTSLASALALRQ